jgi:hypothetical protein
MSYLHRKAAARAVRPVVDGLESRALLSTMTGAHAEVAALKMKHLSTIALIAKTKPQKASTVPSNGDVNPYGVAFVPSGFPSGGKISAGDVLVSNFNNSGNLQGTGTTIVSVGPGSSTAAPFYQDSTPTGLSTALGVLQAGYVVVGFFPSTDGTVATAKPGGLLFIDKNGKPAATLSDPNLLDGPWGMAINDHGSSAQIFVANALRGTVTRIDATFSSTGTISTTMTQIASGYVVRADPTAFEIGPTGLAFNPTTHILYVASTGDNQVYAIPNADTVGTQNGTGSVVYKDKAHLHGPLDVAFAPDGNLIASQGDAVNPSKRQPSELVEFALKGTKGKFVGQFSLNKMPGGAFGVATAPDGSRFAAVNDITNSLEIWPV